MTATSKLSKNILLTISYDGSDFCGWQRQSPSARNECDSMKNSSRILASGRAAAEVRTVQGVIETALERLFKRKISLQGSGRTDSGVHAKGQAANFICPVDSFPAENLPLALNNFLPPDVRVNSASVADDDFSSRFNATSRIYRYFILPKVIPSAASNRFVWHIKNIPNIATLNEMCSVLKGETDCATFTAVGDQSLSTCRYIDGARFFEQTDLFGQRLLVFEIEANAFLWRMVRSLTGTLIDFERKGKNAGDFKAVLDSCERKNAGPTAPATGLFLWQVKFDGTRRHI